MNILTVVIASTAALGLIVLFLAVALGFCIGAIAISAVYIGRLQKHGLIMDGDRIVSIADTGGVFASPEMIIQ